MGGVERCLAAFSTAIIGFSLSRLTIIRHWYSITRISAECFQRWGSECLIRKSRGTTGSSTMRSKPERKRIVRELALRCHCDQVLAICTEYFADVPRTKMHIRERYAFIESLTLRRSSSQRTQDIRLALLHHNAVCTI